MALNDLMAQQIMGEIDTLTKHIDKQIAQVAGNAQALNELDQKLIQSQQNLLSATAEAHKAHVAMLADSAISAKSEIESQTQAHIDQIKRDVVAISDDEVRIMREEADNVRAVAVSGTLDAIKTGVIQKINEGMQGVELANGVFEKQGKEFIIALASIKNDAQEAVKNYDKSLQHSAESHRPLGWFGTTVISVGCGFFGVLLAVFVFSMGWIPLPEKSLTDAQKTDLKNGELIGKAWPKLDEQEKAKLQKLWN